jgi:DNA-binding beta-propeller fold protein YncE
LVALNRWGMIAAMVGVSLHRVCLLIVTIGVVGCAAAPPPPEPPRLVWPPPPAPPRIEFVQSLSSGEDLRSARSAGSWLLDLVGGSSPTVDRLAEPMGVAVSDDGNRVYVADHAQHAIFVFDLARRSVHRLGVEPIGRPVGLALDGEERVWVVEQVRRGVGLFARDGRRLAFIGHPTLERPVGLALDRARRRLYVADAGTLQSAEHTVKIFDWDGRLVGAIGRDKGDGPGQFLFPTYVAVDANGRVYVSDTLNGRVQVFDPDGRYVATIGERGTAWGMFDTPKGVALDGFGNVYVVDSGWSNVQIFNQRRQVLLFFGGRGPLPGLLKNPTAIAIDRDNRIYVADYLNRRVEAYRLVNTTAEDSFLDPAAARTR